MKALMNTATVALIAALLIVPSAVSQEKPGFSGHWEGTAKAGGQNMPFTVDLAKDAKGAWIGSISMGGGKGIPFSEVKIDGSTVSLKLPVAGAPVLEGKISEDEKTIAGTAVQAGATSTFELKRTGEPKVDVAPPSSALTADFEGNWEGTIETPGGNFRLVLKLSKAADGTASGVLDSVDQGASIPVTSVIISGGSLSFEIRLIGGEYKGALNEPKSEITGVWKQGGMSLPLVLKKTQAKQ